MVVTVFYIRTGLPYTNESNNKKTTFWGRFPDMNWSVTFRLGLVPKFLESNSKRDVQHHTYVAH